MIAARIWGKLPAHGDFVARGLAADARDALDRWLATSLAAARGVLGEACDEIYDRAPPWRFAWRGDGDWSAGAIAPSVDGVGRRYPLLVAVDGLADTQVEDGAGRAERLLYDALASGWDADRLHAALGALTPEAAGAWRRGEGWWTLGTPGSTPRHLAGARPPELMRAVLTMGRGNA